MPITCICMKSGVVAVALKVDPRRISTIKEHFEHKKGGWNNIFLDTIIDESIDFKGFFLTTSPPLRINLGEYLIFRFDSPITCKDGYTSLHICNSYERLINNYIIVDRYVINTEENRIKRERTQCDFIYSRGLSENKMDSLWKEACKKSKPLESVEIQGLNWRDIDDRYYLHFFKDMLYKEIDGVIDEKLKEVEELRQSLKKKKKEELMLEIESYSKILFNKLVAEELLTQCEIGYLVNHCMIDDYMEDKYYVVDLFRRYFKIEYSLNPIVFKQPYEATYYSLYDDDPSDGGFWEGVNTYSYVV